MAIDFHQTLSVISSVKWLSYTEIVTVRQCGCGSFHDTSGWAIAYNLHAIFKIKCFHFFFEKEGQYES